MKKQDYIMLIMNCEKYKYKAQKQRDSWLREIPADLIYFHVIGNEKLETDYIFDNENSILYVKTKDDYNSLPHKVISAYEAVNSTFEYKYLFKTDDDQFLTHVSFLKLLMNFLLTSPTNYGGKIVNVATDHISEYYHYHPELPHNVLVKKSQYCNGRFYILSKMSVENLLTKKHMIHSEYFEDYAIGYYLDNEIKNPILAIPNDVFVDF